MSIFRLIFTLPSTFLILSPISSSPISDRSGNKSGIFALGGPCDLEIDGNPATHGNTPLIHAATRHVAACTGVDLSPCTRWTRVLDIRYFRLLKGNTTQGNNNNNNNNNPTTPGYYEVTALFVVDDAQKAIPSEIDWPIYWEQRHARRAVDNQPPEEELVDQEEDEEPEDGELPDTAPPTVVPETTLAAATTGKSAVPMPATPRLCFIGLHNPIIRLKTMSISLDGLLDYNESDTEEATFELSMLAEALHELISRDAGEAILEALKSRPWVGKVNTGGGGSGGNSGGGQKRKAGGGAGGSEGGATRDGDVKNAAIGGDKSGGKSEKRVRFDNGTAGGTAGDDGKIGLGAPLPGAEGKSLSAEPTAAVGGDNVQIDIVDDKDTEPKPLGVDIEGTAIGGGTAEGTDVVLPDHAVDSPPDFIGLKEEKQPSAEVLEEEEGKLLPTEVSTEEKSTEIKGTELKVKDKAASEGQKTENATKQGKILSDKPLGDVEGPQNDENKEADVAMAIPGLIHDDDVPGAADGNNRNQEGQIKQADLPLNAEVSVSALPIESTSTLLAGEDDMQISPKEKSASEKSAGGIASREKNKPPSDPSKTEIKDPSNKATTPASSGGGITSLENLMLAFSYFDAGGLGYILTEDLKVIVESLGLGVHHSIARKLCESVAGLAKGGKPSEKIDYRKLCRMK